MLDSPYLFTTLPRAAKNDWQTISPPGSTLYYCLRFLPAQKRELLLPLYALQYEMTSGIKKCSDRSVAIKKLQWWLAEWEKTQQQQASHPITQSLAPIISNPENKALLNAYFEAMSSLALTQTLPNQEALIHYCHYQRGLLEIIADNLLENYNEEYAINLGIALQLSENIFCLRDDILHGQILIPETSLEKYHITTEQLFELKMNDSIRELLSGYKTLADSYFSKAKEVLPDSTKTHGRAFAAITQTLLNEIAHEGFPLFEKHISLTPLRKLWLAWRAIT